MFNLNIVANNCWMSYGHELTAQERLLSFDKEKEELLHKPTKVMDVFLPPFYLAAYERERLTNCVSMPRN
jgi:hypothetical protein